MGSFCLVSSIESHFDKKESQYFQIFSDLVAIGIESARINQILLAHSRTRTWFYRKAAHDLRAPLAAIRSKLALITKGYVTDKDKTIELVDRVITRTEGLSEMVNDLLILAEDRLDMFNPEFEEVKIKEVFESIVELYETEARKKNITFIHEIEGDISPVKATRDGVERIFSNLISNAIKYSRENGKVEIRVSENANDKVVSFTINDSGIGIPKDEQKNLFKEFFRAPNAKKLTVIGSGLGLTITKKLVTDFGGAIDFVSEENVGSTFRVLIPTIHYVGDRLSPQIREQHFQSLQV
jgi:hypothetical protein